MPHVDRDPAALRRELQRVVDEVEEHLFEPPDVAAHLDRRHRRQLEVDRARRRRRDHRFDDAADQLANVDVLHLQATRGRTTRAKSPGALRSAAPAGWRCRRSTAARAPPCRRRASPRCSIGGPSEDRVERRAQLVRHDRDELVLDAVGRLRVGPRALRRLVQPRAIERLRAVLRDRHQQRLILVVEVHRHGEIERQHADRRALRRAAASSPTTGSRRRPPTAADRQNRSCHSSSDRMNTGCPRRTASVAHKPVLDRHARAARRPAGRPPRRRASRTAVPSSTSSVHLAGGRADDDAAVLR